MLSSLLALSILYGPPESALPSLWHGDWRGPLSVVSAKGSSKLAMELGIAPIKDSGRLTWRIVYDEAGKRQVRPYELHPVDKKPGFFVIDEKNGIVIDARLVGDVLLLQFKVNDVLVTTRYERVADELRVEIISYRFSKPRITSPDAAKIEVQSFEMIGMQSGVLKRADK